ncbi:hypothetical protein NX794_09200 [Streptomyces sp. LP11]|uniref:Uncharacterized protein n=1 Tax=Streptomyces pyxinicus TaxID=2970331 RepID=A0ABT2AYR3_9ACTN|nr:hypothetical protein [Streptomyces sp. LP11]MCS0601403.1 hypothetical protein [Streptomyces sp. LP11]
MSVPPRTRRTTAPTAFTLSAAAVLLNLALWHASLLSAAHGTAGTALLTLWLLMVWGFAPGALTHLLVEKGARSTPFRTTAMALACSWVISALLHAFLTDPDFRAQAMNGPGHHHPVPRLPGVPTVGLAPLLVPVSYAVVFTVILGARRPRPERETVR